MATISRTFYDATVATDGTGDYATIAAAITDNKRTIYVRQGSYAGFTQDQSQSKIFVEPGSTITSDCNFTGTNCSFVVGAGTDIQGKVSFDTNSSGCYFRCENGVQTDGIDYTTTERQYLNGGGWGTLSDGGSAAHGINVGSSDDCIIENIAVQTTLAGGGYSGVNANSGTDRAIYRLVKVVDSDDEGFQLFGDDTLIIGCVVSGADARGITTASTGLRVRAIGNYITATGDDAIRFAGADSVAVGNVAQIDGGYAFEVVAANCVAVGNRLDGASNDTAGSSTISSNDETAF